MKIKYLVCYDTEKNKEQNRIYAPSSVPVVESVLASLKNNGYAVEVISFSSTNNGSPVPSTRYLLKEGYAIQLFKSFGRRNYFSRILNRIALKAQYFWYLLCHIQKDDVVIAYHSPYHVNTLRFLKRIKSFRLILQMLEIYADVYGDRKLKKQELALAQDADAYIFSTEQLNQTINTEQKPAVIMLGTYRIELERNTKFNDGKIHVLYAGTLDPRKGGAVAAAAAAYLPDNYHIHILGFGSDEEKKYLQKVIEENTLPYHASVSYDGLLSGEEYIRFVQSCDIGLSTQMPDAAFNATSFPSKILSYMSNGLRVVSVRIKAVETSAIGDLITYYDNQIPECIANAIMSVDILQPYDSRKRVLELDKQFQQSLEQLIEANYNENNC